MLSLKEYLKYSEMSEEELDLCEALDLRARMKLKQSIRKNKSKIAMGRKKAEKRVANPEKLKKRAQKQARREVEKKILKDKDKSELSFQQRAELEKRVNKRKDVINRIAKKLIPKVKKDELERKRGGGKSE